MVSPLHPDIFPKVIRNYVAMANVYAAVADVIPSDDRDGGDPRKYVDRLAPDALNDAGRQLQLLVRELERLGKIDEFRHALSINDPNNFYLASLLADAVPVDEHGRIADSALQSIQNRTEPFRDSELFFNTMPAARHRVCAIAIDGAVAGSGFLIGPDLVMTARHTLDLLGRPPLIRTSPPGSASKEAAVDGSDQRLNCVFDYLGMLIGAFPKANPPKNVLLADLAPDWLAWSSQRHPQDGVGHVFRDPPSITERLDCAIIRLAQRVGEMATDRGGGRIRGWFELPHEMDDLTEGQIIALLQYPAGGPQKFGDGRYKAYAAGRTRLWYSTDAAGGSSGAPCLDSQCRVVGFHNAGNPRQPESGIDTATCNQGVAILPVVKALPEDLLEAVRSANAPESALWSVGDAEEIRPLLGREKLRGWIGHMAGAAPAKRVVVVDDADPPRGAGRTGKTFSARILRAMMKSRPGVVVQFDSEQLQGVEPDAFLKDLAAQAGLPTSASELPARPTEERQLTRWWANDLPHWFAGLVEDAARASGSAARESSTGPGEDEIVLAPIWIVIDRIHEHALPEPLRECIAGLIGVTDPLINLPPGLRALRWLIIGHVPDFILDKSIEYERDSLAQSDLGEAEWVACCKAAFQSRGLLDRFSPGEAADLRDYAELQNPVLRTFAETGCPDESYLTELAGAAANAIALMLKRAVRQ
jgi:hypothetical protein